MLGLGRVVAAVAADVHIERDVIVFRPGVQGQMRLGQHHGAGDAFTFSKAVKQTAHGGQAGVGYGLLAKGLEIGGIDHQTRIAAATIEVANEVQTRRLRWPVVYRMVQCVAGGGADDRTGMGKDVHDSSPQARWPTRRPPALPATTANPHTRATPAGSIGTCIRMPVRKRKPVQNGLRSERQP